MHDATFKFYEQQLQITKSKKLLIVTCSIYCKGNIAIKNYGIIVKFKIHLVMMIEYTEK